MTERDYLIRRILILESHLQWHLDQNACWVEGREQSVETHNRIKDLEDRYYGKY